MTLINNISYFDSKALLDDYLFKKIEQLGSLNTHTNIILSGGASPVALYKRMGDSFLSLKQFRFVLSDDRRVKIDDALSNEGMLYRTLGKTADFQLLSLHSHDIEMQLQSIPYYDLAILGMGLDGHFASIFPDMTNLESALSSKHSIEFVNDGYPEVPRITMTLNEINKAKEIILLIYGQEKLDLLLNLDTNSNLPIKYLLSTTHQKILIATYV